MVRAFDKDHGYLLVQSESRITDPRQIPARLSCGASDRHPRIDIVRQAEQDFPAAIVIDTFGTQDGCVHDGSPTVLHVQFWLVDQLAKAAHNLRRHHPQFHRSMFYLALVICHVYQLGMRAFIPEAAAFTPPRMRGPLPRHFGHAFIKDAERYIRGEAGYFWEQGVIGGIVEYTRDEIVDAEINAIYVCSAQLGASGSRAGYWELGADLIMRIVQSKSNLAFDSPTRPGPKEWPLLLPLKPTIACPWQEGLPPNHAKRFPGPSEHENETLILPDGKVLVGRRCGRT